jgi:hypothetical protein
MSISTGTPTILAEAYRVFLSTENKVKLIFLIRSLFADNALFPFDLSFSAAGLQSESLGRLLYEPLIHTQKNLN